MIETDLGTLVNVNLASALKYLASVRVPSPQTRHDLRTLMQCVEVEAQKWESERLALIEELGEPIGVTKDGRPLKEVKQTSSAWSTFMARMNEYATVKATLPCSMVTMTLPKDFPLSVNEETALQSLVQFAEDSNGR